MRKGLRFHIIRNWAVDGFDLEMYERVNDGRKVSIVKNIEMETIDAEDFYMIAPNRPMLFFATEIAVEIMDQLWNAGIRPTEARDKNDVISAKNSHIEDLRKVLDAFIRVKNG